MYELSQEHWRCLIVDRIVTSWCNSSSRWWCSFETDCMWYYLETQRCEKISNKSSFGIIDITQDSSTSDRIIVIVDTVRFIHDGAYRWRSGCHVNVPASHWLAPITCTRWPAEKAMRPRCSSNATADSFSEPQSKDEMWWPSWSNDCNRRL